MKLSVASKVALIKDCYEVRSLESCGKYSQKRQQEVKRSAWLAAETRLKVFNCQLLLFIMCISVSPPLDTQIYMCVYTQCVMCCGYTEKLSVDCFFGKMIKLHSTYYICYTLYFIHSQKGR